MKAIQFHRYGPADVLRWEEAPDPQPGRGEVRVRVHAAALNPKDVLVRKGKLRVFTGRRFPQRSGYDLAGEVDALGPGVRSLRMGEEVFAMIQSWRAGACAELAIVPEGELAPKPRSISMTDAAGIPLAALTALQALRDLARVRRGERVVINGASGGVGVFAVQIAKLLGAHTVAVCSAKNAEHVSRLGADEVVPYDERALEAEPGPFDVIFDVFGSAPHRKVKHLLDPRGRYVTTIPSPGHVFRDLTTRWTKRPARLVVVRSRRRDLEQLARWVDAGELAPVTDRVWPMADAAEAHAYIETKRARGKVVLEVG
ncbi:MAG: NAD(P)-dependent alcohol dehydrogenase [Sandaracinaceae bacterium]